MDAVGPGGSVRRVPPDSLPQTWADCGGQPTLVYWDIRGLAQSVRLALEYAGKPYVDVRIAAGAPGTPEYKQAWMKEKAEVGKSIPFPNLPYYIDESTAMSQSTAILRHVARTGGFLYPEGTPPARVDFLLEQLADFDGGLTGMCYRSYDNGKDQWVEGSMQPGLAQFEALLGDAPFFGGATVSAADFKAYEEFDKCRIIAPGCLDGYPKLAGFVARVEAIPAIASYLKSDRFAARPLNNPHAQFK